MMQKNPLHQSVNSMLCVVTLLFIFVNWNEKKSHRIRSNGCIFLEMLYHYLNSTIHSIDMTFCFVASKYLSRFSFGLNFLLVDGLIGDNRYTQSRLKSNQLKIFPIICSLFVICSKLNLFRSGNLSHVLWNWYTA